MSYMIRFLKKYGLKILGISCILFIGAILFFLNISMRQSDTDITKSFGKKGIPCVIRYSPQGIRYVESGLTSADTAVLYIHGAPGSCDAFFTYMQDSALDRRYFQVSVDRKGYGYSDYGHSETSIVNQAGLLQSIIAQYPDKKWILVAHSFGCAIAAVLAVQNKTLVKKIILLGAAADPKYEKMVSWAKISNTKLIRKITGTDIAVATDEKLSHQAELATIEPYWAELDCAVVIMHGTKDNLVPYENVAYLKQRIKPELFKLHSYEGEGHVFVFMKPELLKYVLLGK